MSELFLSIFNTGIMAGWLVLGILVARLLLKKAPSWAKCALWAIVALRLVWPFEIESVLSLIPSAQTLPPSELYDYAPQVHTGIHAANSVINPVFSEVFASEPANSVNPLQVVIAVAAALWLVGMIAMVCYALVSFLQLRRHVRVRMPLGDGVYACDNIASPFILGVFRPKIFLPSDLPEEKRESILAHERAHLARLDHWWKPLGFVLLTVFWFHPLLWVAYILLCRDVELACDEKVIASLSAEEKKAYSEVLLECSMPRKWITACPLAFGETGVKQRIKAVLHYKKPALWIIIAALVIGSVLAVCFLTEPAETEKIHVAGKSYIYEKTDDSMWEFVIYIQKDGTFSYSEGLLSSYIGMGHWEVKGGKLYLYDKGLSNKIRTYVFRVESNALVFCGKESDQFIYLEVADGAHFFFYEELKPIVNHLIFVDILDIQEDYFIGVDAMGTRWKINPYFDTITEDMKKCWVSYYGKVDVLEGDEAKYEVGASRCWLFAENSSPVIGAVFDSLKYDIDDDNVVEECYLMAYINGTGWTGDDYITFLRVYEGDKLEYEVTFDPHLIAPEDGSFGYIPPGLYDHTIYAYANVYAFVFRDERLCIATPSGGKYVTTGELKLFEIVFEDGALTIKDT